MKTFSHEDRLFWLLIAFLVLVLATGGGSRDDVLSLAVLRPAAVLACAAGLFSLTRAHIRACPLVFGLAALWITLHLLQLVPLPPALWQALPGREIVAAVDSAAGLGDVWRPVALVPDAAWNALFSLSVPLAVLVIGVQLSRRRQRQLLLPILAFGVVSGLIGLLQLIGDPRGPLFFYRITNSGSAVGLFANRNHQAILLALALPMLAILAARPVSKAMRSLPRGWLATGIGAFFVPLILVTGSRAGLICGGFGLIAAAILYRQGQETSPKSRKRGRGWPYPAVAAGVVMLVAVTVLASRAEALRRFWQADTEQSRSEIWAQSLEIARIYLPLGSGFGSFPDVYRIHEPLALLVPAYVNHAHNDWIELLVTGGWPAIALALAAFCACAAAAIGAFRRDAPFARLGAVTLAILIAASIGDYPLRVPSLAAIAAVAALWLFAPSGSMAAKRTGN